MAPLTVIEASLPTFDTVTFNTFVVAWLTVPNASEAGDTESSAVAEPESGIAGFDPPVVVNVSVRVLLPTAVGLYSTGSTQLAPAATEVPQVLPVLDSENPVPVIDGVSV